MTIENSNEEMSVSFNKLQWDTEYFGINCAKAILYKPLTLSSWNDLKNAFKGYQFISIENRNSEPVNAQLIGGKTSAFLADVNVQFSKTINNQCQYSLPENITINHGIDYDEQLIDLASFQFSKFIEDPEFAKRGGENVYRQWLINSFNKPDKDFLIYKDRSGDIKGFLLHSYFNKISTIELISVSHDLANSGIGTALFEAIEYTASKNGCDEIRVGTMLRNSAAINFYHKVGCKQIGSHQVYHLWKL